MHATLYDMTLETDFSFSVQTIHFITIVQYIFVSKQLTHETWAA